MVGSCVVEEEAMDSWRGSVKGVANGTRPWDVMEVVGLVARSAPVG